MSPSTPAWSSSSTLPIHTYSHNPDFSLSSALLPRSGVAAHPCPSKSGPPIRICSHPRPALPGWHGLCSAPLAPPAAVGVSAPLSPSSTPGEWDLSVGWSAQNKSQMGIASPRIPLPYLLKYQSRAKQKEPMSTLLDREDLGQRGVRLIPGIPRRQG